jgi:hypothetical protein
VYSVAAILIACALTAPLAFAGVYVVRLMRNVDDFAMRLGAPPTEIARLGLRVVMAVGVAIVSVILVTIWVAVISDIVSR